MSSHVVIVGTDTNVGKTTFSAGLIQQLNAYYWKPIQAGLDGPTDTDTVKLLSGQPQEYFIPEAYRLQKAASPHIAAHLEGIQIDTGRLSLPNTPTPALTLIEAAGGLLVPLNDDTLFIDIIQRWRAPVILCARTTLGTISHTLLSIEALRTRAIPLLGVVFIGDAQEDVETTITHLGKTRHLGRLPILSPLTQTTLVDAFSKLIDLPAIKKAIDNG